MKFLEVCALGTIFIFIFHLIIGLFFLALRNIVFYVQAACRVDGEQIHNRAICVWLTIDQGEIILKEHSAR